MKNYLKLYLNLIKYSILGSIEYRFDFIANILRSVGWAVIALLTFNIIFSQSPVILGWNKNESMTLLGVYMCLNELWWSVLYLNLTNIPKMVEDGEFDYLLLLPISTQFLASFKYFLIFPVFNLVLGLYIIGYYSALVTKNIGLIAYLITALLMLNGFIVLYSITLLLVTLSFWVVRLTAFREFYSTITQGARYPVSFFKDPLKFIFTFIIPIIIIFTFPAQFLVKTLEWRYVLLSFIFGMVLLFISHKFFYFGIKRYNSASS